MDRLDVEHLEPGQRRPRASARPDEQQPLPEALAVGEELAPRRKSVSCS
jgi:hypothetical protein